MQTPAEQRIHDPLCRVPTEGLEAINRPFWSEPDFDRLHCPLAKREWLDRIAHLLAGVPALLAQCEAQSGSPNLIHRDQLGKSAVMV